MVPTRYSLPDTSVLNTIAQAESLDTDRLIRLIQAGRVVVPRNPRRPNPPCAIGEGCKVKVNVNVGTSQGLCDPALEKEKAEAAIQNGGHTLMDLSTGGDLPAIRRMVLSYPVPVGTVPIYEAVRRAGSVQDIDADLLFTVIREHCRDGVDFLTLHCGVNQDVLRSLREDPRRMGVVSRGGSFHVAMMAAQEEENPLWSEFDYLCEILAEYQVVVSLGDGMRPGCHEDAAREAKTVEYLNLGRLARRAHHLGIPRMIEGPGHMPLEQIGYNVRMIKELTDHAPLYLLGPLVTDIASGYDHVVGAIGGAIACKHGANFLCMVSPSEHLALPRVHDIIEGTRASVLAAHVGDLLAGREDARDREIMMGKARQELDWEKQFNLSLFPDVARSIHDRDPEKETCSMCGDLCAVKMVRDLFMAPDDDGTA
ncbi:phosphomethylpyrimidine synthase ThiC [Methanospirillum hungatei]|uniref:phosphomethylpyrimidine synthase ThiC n=1 Tax=Methanospirillum hungatei TaxID=2203 RepID=UPI0026F0D506|nr:phosphomethylpyrimidine synthase ThiC [Methanospirillum hungatei]MCA1916945.1 phosphomethylpyrimidine synthase ThiC [Methanospirillum hungatei]